MEYPHCRKLASNAKGMRYIRELGTAPLHWCHDMRPCSGPVLYMEGPTLNHPYRRPHSNNEDTIQNAASEAYIIFAQ